MKKIVSIFVIFIALQMNAQTGIGTTTPNASAKLEVYATNKGFLPPRVTLTSATDATTIASPAEGLLVYNLGSVGLQAGYYYWSGTGWSTIATATGAGVMATDMVLLYNKAYTTNSGDIDHADGYTFTVPVSGKYLFDFSSSAFVNYGIFTLTFNVRSGTTILGTDYQTSYNNNAHVEYNGKIEVNLQAGVNYNLTITTTGGRATNDWNRVYMKMVAGNLPVTGQTVEYGIARYSGPDTGGLTAGALISFDATAAGNLNWSSNKFTLKGNKTYELESSMAIFSATNGTAGRFQIYDYTNSTALANGLFMSQNGAGVNNPNANSPMKCIVTPTTDIQVGIRLLDYYGPVPSIIGSAATAGSNSPQNASYFMAKQIGSSAIINPWVLNGNNVYNTSGKVGIGNNSPNAQLDVRTSPTSTTDPGAGFIGIGTTNSTASTAGAGAVRYNISNGLMEFSNGSTWLSLAPGNPPMYAQFRSNAAQTFYAAGGKMDFPTTYINVGGFSISGNNTITLPAGRVYRLDLNLGWASISWGRFAIYNASSNAAISSTAHFEGATSGAYAGSGSTTTFVNTSSGSITIDVRYVAPANIYTTLGDTGNGTNFPTITIQSVD